MGKQRIGAIALACMLLAGVSAAADSGPRLILRDMETGNNLLAVPVEYGRPFSLRYIHSVDISPVHEFFRAEKGRGIVLDETCFRMFGAGMGHREGRGVLKRDGPWTCIAEMDETLGRFVLRIGARGVDHTLRMDFREFDLSGMAAGRRVAVFLEER
jgi:hypothetical protein